MPHTIIIDIETIFVLAENPSHPGKVDWIVNEELLEYFALVNKTLERRSAISASNIHICYPPLLGKSLIFISFKK